MEKLAITQLQILWAIRKTEKTGKEIIESLSTMRKRKVVHPNIYTALRKMEKAGLVESRPSGRSVIWKITGKGRKKLDEMAYLLLDSIDSIIEEMKCSRCNRVCR